MSDAYQCDKCKKYFSEKPVLKVNVYERDRAGDPLSHPLDGEFCPACAPNIISMLQKMYYFTDPAHKGERLR